MSKIEWKFDGKTHRKFNVTDNHEKAEYQPGNGPGLNAQYVKLPAFTW